MKKKITFLSLGRKTENRKKSESRRTNFQCVCRDSKSHEPSLGRWTSVHFCDSLGRPESLLEMESTRYVKSEGVKERRDEGMKG